MAAQRGLQGKRVYVDRFWGARRRYRLRTNSRTVRHALHLQGNNSREARTKDTAQEVCSQGPRPRSG
jgi:hypothetical protein